MNDKYEEVLISEYKKAVEAYDLPLASSISELLNSYQKDKLNSCNKYSREIKFERIQPIDFGYIQQEYNRIFSNQMYGFYGGNIIPLLKNYVNEEKWLKMGRIGFGNNYWQEYSLDEKGSLYVYTSILKPEFPEDVPYIAETQYLVSRLNRGAVYKFALVE